MNALKSMMRATARVRRDGTEASISGDELVSGDIVLIAAGDQVPADGRINSTPDRLLALLGAPQHARVRAYPSVHNLRR